MGPACVCQYGSSHRDWGLRPKLALIGFAFRLDPRFQARNGENWVCFARMMKAPSKGIPQDCSELPAGEDLDVAGHWKPRFLVVYGWGSVETHHCISFSIQDTSINVRRQVKFWETALNQSQGTWYSVGRIAQGDGAIATARCGGASAVFSISEKGSLRREDRI